jgi:glucose-6-phosphate dehydrogenase assembly protein OpcA
VEPGAIDRELRKMWSQASADPAHPLIRARILNLVIFVDAPELAETSDAAADLAARHPSRTIIAAMNPAAPDSRLSAEVSVRCNLSFGRRQQICSEQIVIRADGRSVDDVHGLVSPLLTSDLRTFLWWRRSGLPAGHSFEVLADHCNRILLDSARTASGAIDLAALLALVKEMGRRKPSPIPIGDLNWTRLGVWRAALASLYDVPAYRERLARLERVTIAYNPPAPSRAATAPAHKSGRASTLPIEPVLIAGWLASRLGWTGPQVSPQIERRPDWVLTFANTPGVELVVSPAGAKRAGVDAAGLGLTDSRSTGVRAVSKIQFECSGQRPTSFSVGFNDSCLETTVVIEGQTQSGRVVAFDDKLDGDLVAEELDIVGNDVVYEDAIRMAATLGDLL